MDLIKQKESSHGTINVYNLQDKYSYMNNIYYHLSKENFSEPINNTLDKTLKMSIISNIFAKNILQNNSTFIDIYDNKVCNLFNVKYIYNTLPITIFYYFNKIKPFIIIQSYTYLQICFYYDISSKSLIVINNGSDPGLDNFLNSPNLLDELNNVNQLINIKQLNKKYLLYGLIETNYAHQDIELNGLSYAIDNNLLEQLDALVINESLDDIYKVDTYLKSEYPNLKIITYDEFKTNEYGIAVHFGSYTNMDTSKDIITKVVGYNNEENNVSKYINKQLELNNKLIEITFDIRVNRRIIYNLKDLYKYIINALIQDFPEYVIKINFTGNISLKNNYGDRCRQNEIANDIINSFNYENNSNIFFVNTIGTPFCNLLNNIIKSDLFIGVGGASGLILINWFFKKPMYMLTYSKEGLFNDFQYVHNSLQFTQFIPENLINYDYNCPYFSPSTITDIPSTYLSIKKMLLEFRTF